MKTEKIIWNGCDGYVLLSDAMNDPDLSKKIEGDTLYTTTEAHRAIAVIEVDEPEIDEDGLTIDDDVYTVATRNGYRFFTEV